MKNDCIYELQPHYTTAVKGELFACIKFEDSSIRNIGYYFLNKINVFICLYKFAFSKSYFVPGSQKPSQNLAINSL